MSLPLPGFVDERFLNHRRRATSNAGVASAILAILLFAYHFYRDHVFDRGLLAVALLFLVLKYGLFFWYRRTD